MIAGINFRQDTVMSDFARRGPALEGWAMIDNLDELVLLLLRTSGMHDAALTYEEEAGVSHAEATTVVGELARRGQPGPQKSDHTENTKGEMK